MKMRRTLLGGNLRISGRGGKGGRRGERLLICLYVGRSG